MRFAALFLAILAASPAVTFAAPIGGPEHFEELEARWNPFKSKGFSKFVKTAGNVYRKAAPIVKTIAPLIIKREDEVQGHLYERDLEQELEARDWEELAEA